jgi:hypothetical protein
VVALAVTCEVAVAKLLELCVCVHGMVYRREGQTDRERVLAFFFESWGQVRTATKLACFRPRTPGICRFAGELAIWPVFLVRMIGSVWSCICAFVSMDMVVSTRVFFLHT